MVTDLAADKAMHIYCKLPGKLFNVFNVILLPEIYTSPFYLTLNMNRYSWKEALGDTPQK